MRVLKIGPRKEWYGAMLAIPANLDFGQESYAEGLNIWPGAELQGRIGVES